MLQPMMHWLSSQRIVLASGSPRRKQILENIGLKFEVVPSTFEENLDKTSFQFPYQYCLQTAKHKTLEVANKLASDERRPALVIGADTVVAMDNKIFEKPRDKDHALEMLSSFCGKDHTVYTGLVLVVPKPDAGDGFNVYEMWEGTDVQFPHHSTEVLKAYIETGEPMDKAGGYGIQAAGGTLIQGIRGDYFNVMGFPLHAFAKKVSEIFEDKMDRKSPS